MAASTDTSTTTARGRAIATQVASAAVQGASEVAKAPKAQSFGKAMQQAQAQPSGKPQPAAKAQAPQAVPHAKPSAPAQRVQAKAPAQVQPVARKPEATALVNEVSSAQAKLDQILKMAESGRTFSPAELLAFQAHAYRASQELELAGKVVEKATSGVKQTLNTQV